MGQSPVRPQQSVQMLNISFLSLSFIICHLYMGKVSMVSLCKNIYADATNQKLKLCDIKLRKQTILQRMMSIIYDLACKQTLKSQHIQFLLDGKENRHGHGYPFYSNEQRSNLGRFETIIQNLQIFLPSDSLREFSQNTESVCRLH